MSGLSSLKCQLLAFEQIQSTKYKAYLHTKTENFFCFIWYSVYFICNFAGKIE